MPAADIMSCSLGWNGSVDLGQFVVTGEPVAVMGGGAQWPLPKRAVQTNPYFTWSSARAGFPSIQARGGPQTKARRFADDHAQDFPDSPRCGGRRSRDANRNLAPHLARWGARTSGRRRHLSPAQPVWRRI